MKKLQQLCAATLLLFVLSLPAFAGNIHTNVVDPPPPPPESATATESLVHHATTVILTIINWIS